MTAIPSPADRPPRPDAGYGASADINPFAAPSTDTESTDTPIPRSEWSARQITPDEVFAKSWAIFKRSWTSICLAALIVLAFNFALGQGQAIIMQVIAVAIRDRVATLSAQIVMGFVAWVVQTWLGIGQFMYLVDIARGRESRISKLFAGGPFLIQALLAAIMVGLIYAAVGVVLVGLPAAVAGLAMQDVAAAEVAGLAGGVVAVVPVVIIGLMFSQVQPLIIECGLNATESLRTSREITRGNRVTLLFINILLMLIAFGAAIVGLLAFCIGIFPAIIGMSGFSALVFAVTFLCMTSQEVVVS